MHILVQQLQQEASNSPSIYHSESSDQNFSMDFQFQQANFVSLQKLPIMNMHYNHCHRVTDHLLLHILLLLLLNCQYQHMHNFNVTG